MTEMVLIKIKQKILLAKVLFIIIKYQRSGVAYTHGRGYQNVLKWIQQKSTEYFLYYLASLPASLSTHNYNKYNALSALLFLSGIK